ncbi:PUR3 [Scenedesmus sp. PABB004]|nr:PUR3 [Scenedesmus sp. PABB004]
MQCLRQRPRCCAAGGGARAAPRPAAVAALPARSHGQVQPAGAQPRRAAPVAAAPGRGARRRPLAAAAGPPDAAGAPGPRKKLAVFVSGGGSNFKAIHAACLSGAINADVVVRPLCRERAAPRGRAAARLPSARRADGADAGAAPQAVVSDVPSCGGVAYAAAAGIATLTYPASRKGLFPGLTPDELVSQLAALGAEYVVLAGFLKLIPSELCRAYKRRMLNIHPGLLPSFGGKGFYGGRVHAAVLASGARFSGPTVHFVDEEYDTGPILAQRVVPVFPTDSPAQLAARVLEQEHLVYPYAVSALVDGRITAGRGGAAAHVQTDVWSPAPPRAHTAASRSASSGSSSTPHPPPVARTRASMAQMVALGGRAVLAAVRSSAPGACRPRVAPFGAARPSSSSAPRRASSSSSSWGTPERCVSCRSFDGDAGKALKEAAALDELIDLMLEAKTQPELSRLVAENIFSFDAKFWMRIATRNDSLASQADKEKLKGVADTVMLLVDAMVRQTEQSLNDSAAVLQEVLKAAADDKGEWYVPLDSAQVAAVRAALEKHASRLDEALLSNCFAWMKKCADDGMVRGVAQQAAGSALAGRPCPVPGSPRLAHCGARPPQDTMVALLQKVLQLYAAAALRGAETEGAEGVLNEVIYAEEADWEPILRKHAAAGGVAEAGFMDALQRRMEATVLGMQSGSYAQRVQAEYLKEVEARAKTVFRALAAAAGP